MEEKKKNKIQEDIKTLKDFLHFLNERKANKDLVWKKNKNDRRT